MLTPIVNGCISRLRSEDWRCVEHETSFLVQINCDWFAWCVVTAVALLLLHSFGFQSVVFLRFQGCFRFFSYYSHPRYPDSLSFLNLFSGCWLGGHLPLNFTPPWRKPLVTPLLVGKHCSNPSAAFVLVWKSSPVHSCTYDQNHNSLST